jgi:hypothetical protein
LLNGAASAVIRGAFCAAHLAWNFLAWRDAAWPGGLRNSILYVDDALRADSENTVSPPLSRKIVANQPFSGIEMM